MFCLSTVDKFINQVTDLAKIFLFLRTHIFLKSRNTLSGLEFKGLKEVLQRVTA